MLSLVPGALVGALCSTQTKPDELSVPIVFNQSILPFRKCRNGSSEIKRVLQQFITQLAEVDIQ